MEGGVRPVYNLRKPEDVFKDYRGRRAGLIKALTTESKAFFRQCDPERENLCLYGQPNETWEVMVPAEQVPPELPEPAIGINFARDGMEEKAWLTLVATYSDSWLLSLASYFGARFGFEQDDRKRLFTMINNLPTIREVVTKGYGSKQTQEKAPNSQSVSKMEKGSKEPPKDESTGDDNDGEDNDDDEHDDAVCGACGRNNTGDQFWICCDICERWFHGKCVKITPARAEHIEQYKCPDCSHKRARS